MQDKLDAILESITHSKHEDQEAKPSTQDKKIGPEVIFSATLKDLIKASAGKSVCEVCNVHHRRPRQALFCTIFSMSIKGGISITSSY